MLYLEMSRYLTLSLPRLYYKSTKQVFVCPYYVSKSMEYSKGRQLGGLSIGKVT
jgi:hypothetical protein